VTSLSPEAWTQTPQQPQPVAVAAAALPSELRAATNQERSSGKAPPPRPTTHQRQVMERLIAQHGEDVEVRGKRA
jgi:hypothetical protein